MNRKQFLSFAGKLKRLATQLDADAKRVRVSGHPFNELADDLRIEAENLRRIANTIESQFG